MNTETIIVIDLDGASTVATLEAGLMWDRPSRKIKVRGKPVPVDPDPPPVGPPPTPVEPEPGNIYVPKTAAELQSAIDKAAGGDEIHLAAGLTYSGNFVLPGKPSPVTIRGGDLSWGAAGRRAKPSDGPRMSRVATPNSQPAFYAAKDADNWRLVGLEIAASSAVHTYNVVQIGDLDGAKTLDELPDNIGIERCYIHGDAALGGRRGVLAMGTRVTVRDSWIGGFFAGGNDTQAVLITEGQGPTLVENNYLEGAGENVFIASESPVLVGQIPSNITIRRNHLHKRLAWKPPNTVVLKNLLEIKSGRNVVIEGNVLENNWASGQSGFAVLFTNRDENGDNQAEISNVVFRNNLLRNVANGWNLLGKDDNAANMGRLFGVLIENNMIEGPVRRAFQFLNGIEDVTVRRNTVLGVTTSAWLSDQLMSDRIVFTGNAIGRGEYGIHHSGVREGADSIAAFWRNWDVQGNVFVGAVPDYIPGRYPPGNTFVADAASVPAGVGVDMAALNNAIAGVVQ